MKTPRRPFATTLMVTGAWLVVAAGAHGQDALPMPEAAEAKPPVVQPDGLRVPEGFRAVAGTTAEPYTKTGWAKAIVHEATGMEMVYIPAGAFTAGSPAAETGRGGNETQHRVTLTRGLYLGRCEVTQSQWLAAMGSNPANAQNVAGDGPVEGVSWNDSQAFCAKLGTGFRLPTEAEWEYACRAGNADALPNGKELTAASGRCRNLDEIAWYDENSADTPHPTGQKKPNAWGLHDTLGNVREWCQDWFGDYPEGNLTDPAGPETGSFRVLRGGSWSCSAKDCRSADRDCGSPAYRLDDVGCRVVKTLP